MFRAAILMIPVGGVERERRYACLVATPGKYHEPPVLKGKWVEGLLSRVRRFGRWLGRPAGAGHIVDRAASDTVAADYAERIAALEPGPAGCVAVIEAGV